MRPICAGPCVVLLGRTISPAGSSVRSLASGSRLLPGTLLLPETRVRSPRWLLLSAVSLRRSARIGRLLECNKGARLGRHALAGIEHESQMTGDPVPPGGGESRRNEIAGTRAGCHAVNAPPRARGGAQAP